MAADTSFGAHVRSSWRSRGSTGFVTITMVVALAASSLALVFGASNPGGVLDVLDGRTWLRNDDGLVLANNASGKADFKLQGHDLTGNLQVVQNGRAAVLVDRDDDTVGAIDLSRFRVVNRSKVGTEVDVVPAGTDVFVIHRDTGLVELRDALTNEKVGSIQVDGTLTRGVVDGDGTLYVADKTSGALRSIKRSGKSLRLDRSVSVAARGDDLDVGLLNGDPVVLDSDAARLVVVVDGEAQAPVDLPLEPGDKPPPVLARESEGPVLPLTVNDSGALILVRDGRASRVSLPDAQKHDLGEPVPYGDTVYVPDFTSGKVLLVDHEGASSAPIQARNGAGTFDVFVNEGSLFINDPAGNGTVIGHDGVPRPIDKGDKKIPTNVDPPNDTPPPDPQPDPQRESQPVATPTAGTGGAAPAGPAPVVIAPGAPAAPTNPTATRENASTTVSWGAADDHGAPITDYALSCASNDGGPGATAHSGTSLNVHVTGLKNGKTYTCAVQALNSSGYGPTATTPAFRPSALQPDPPLAPTADAGDQQLTVHFTPLTADQMSGVDVSGYRIACTPDSGTPVSQDSTASQTSVTLTAVNGSAYSCTVSALVGTTPVGSPSPASAAAVPFGAPSITSQSAAPTGTTSAHVSFAVGYNGGDPAASTCTIDASFSGPCGNFDIGGLSPGTPYTWTITVTNPSRTPTQVTVGTTTASPPPPPPPPPQPTISLGHGATVSGCTKVGGGVCTWVSVSATNFAPGSYTFRCTFSGGGAPAQFNITIGGGGSWSANSSTCYSGFVETITVTIGSASASVAGPW